MTIGSEGLWIAALYGALIALAAIGQYINRPKQPAKQDPVLTGIGMAFGDREQTERLIAVFARCAIALETLADRRASELEDMHRQVMDRLDMQHRREEQEEPRRRPDPAPRRR